MHESRAIFLKKAKQAPACLQRLSRCPPGLEPQPVADISGLPGIKAEHLGSESFDPPPRGLDGPWRHVETFPRARGVEAASGRTRRTGPQPLVDTPPARRAGELCEAPQTAPGFHFQPFLSFSPHQERGRSKPSPPVSGTRRGKTGQWKEGRGSHPTPEPQRLAARRWLHSPREPTPPGRLPAPPRHGPHPQSFRRPSAHPPGRGSGRVPRGQPEQQAWEQRSSHFLAPEGSVASLLPSAKPARAPRPAPRAREEAAAGSRGPRRRRAPSSAGKRPAAAACAAPPRQRSLARCLPRSVPFPRGEVVGARRRRGGEERRVRGRRQGCALGSLPIPAGPAAPGRAGERRAGESRAARQRRERGGGPGVSPREGAQGEGVRGGVTPRARVCKSVSACVCVCVCGEGRARERGVGKRGRAWCVSPGEWRNPRVCLEVAECTDAGVSACASEGGHGGECGKALLSQNQQCGTCEGR
ncbi:PREDICTED: collagen alpha-1(III) chain [Cercocebus atys]|uniref:collagen alpha-1(III) chain n=1 Tax=Cercocebus atys TaxID=9531 RepID=UPI0005F3B5EC|nr:PREDICTED: collagen alpha-1(III) chain [Cercocebus atys]